jgi:mRNA-degrading endonuclease RelE of RelBE toxin-antitoxin system
MADQLVEDVLRYLVEDPRLVEPCRGYWTNVASAQGEKLQSNGYKKTPVALLGGRTITVRTLRLARVAPKRPGPKRGRGKRGGVRVIYYWAVVREQLLMLFIYPKTKQSDLTREQLKTLRRIVEGEYK